MTASVFKMAREEVFQQVRGTSEMPNQLGELLEMQLRRSQNDDNMYRILDMSWGSAKSVLCFKDELPLPPPLLTEEQKEQMRKYRREAVKCEQRLFDIRREKYSSLLLQVMAISDRIQEKDLSRDTQFASDESVNRKNIITDPSQDMEGIRHDDKGQQQKKQMEWEKRESGVSSQNADPVENETFVFNTMQNSVPTGLLMSGFPPPSCEQDCASHKENISDVNTATDKLQKESATGFVECVNSDMSANCAGGSVVSESTVSTVCGPLASEKDSLASTSLSFAYTDCSVTSTVGPEPTKSAQRRLLLDDTDERLDQSYQKIPLSNVPKTSKDKPYQVRKVLHRTKSREKLPASKLSKEDQDHQKELDLLKEQLEYEKKKILKQQVLSRLRSQQKPEKQSCDSIVQDKVEAEVVSSTEGQSKVTNPADERRPKMPSRNIYSITETSHDAAHQDNKNNVVDSEKRSIQPENSSSPNYQLKQETDFHKIPTEELHLHLLSQKSTGRAENVKQGFIDQQSSSLTNFKEDVDKDKFSVISASAKGFLTRRLLKAEKVQALLKTVKDTQEFLTDISREGDHSSQDKTLQDRVYAQLQAAKQSIHNIFHEIPASERMAYISHSRNLAKEREAKKVVKRRQTMGASLSAATVKAIQRRSDGPINKPGQEKRPELKRRSTSPLSNRKKWDIRVLKPRQGNNSPPLPDKIRSKKEATVRNKGTQSTTSRPLVNQAKQSGTQATPGRPLHPGSTKHVPKSTIQETRPKKQVPRTSAGRKALASQTAAPPRRRTVAAKFSGK